MGAKLIEVVDRSRVSYSGRLQGESIANVSREQFAQGIGTADRFWKVTKRSNPSSAIRMRIEGVCAIANLAGETTDWVQCVKNRKLGISSTR